MTTSLALKQTAYNPFLSSLDTLQLTAQSLDKRASRKAVTKALIKPLLALNSTLQAQYERTDRCADGLYLKEHTITKDQKLFTNYCGKRWCSVCSAIKTGELMKGYFHAVESMQKPMFLTLTVVSVRENELKPTIKAMTKTFSQIKNLMRMRKTPINGIRKVESNVNVEAQTFNPHFHLIIDGEEEAKTVRQEWIDRNPDVNPDAQDLKEANSDTLNELFKYVQKSIVGKRFHAKEQDIINRAFLNVRAFQPFGNVRKASTTSDNDTNEEDIILDEDSTLQGEYRTITRFWWNQEIFNWVSYTGEILYDAKISTKARKAVGYIEASNRIRYVRTG
jgi:hypothetical protein